MATAFERHNIRHLSPSSLTLYRSDPGLWARRYLLKWQDSAGPAAWRGSAVEAGFHHWMSGRCAPDAAIEKALGRFELDALGEADDTTSKQRALIEPMTRVAMEAAVGLPAAPSFQIKIEHWLDGVSVPLLMYLDFGFQDFDLDLKTTERIPSEPREDHLFQIGLYHAARKRPQKVLYVSAKKFALYDVTEEHAAAAVRDAVNAARALERYLSLSSDPKVLAGIFSPSTDGFRWNDSLRKMEAELWA